MKTKKSSRKEGKEVTKSWLIIIEQLIVTSGSIHLRLHINPNVKVSDDGKFNKII